MIISNTANTPYKTGSQKIQMNALGLTLEYEISKKE
jgi:hypothetical protein